MKITLVCGLLGAGKTSFIKNCIDAAGEKTVVLVNDFGSLGIDGELISSGGLETVELPSGCVCCSLKMDLVKALKQISLEMSPEHLVIEPSGLASPAGVLESLGAVEFSHLVVVCIVDSSEFAQLYEEEIYGRFFLEQISLADIVLVNKTDLADLQRVSRSVEIIETLNPNALVVKTVEAKLDGGIPEVEVSNKVISGNGHGLPFKTMSLKFEGKCSSETFSELFSCMKDGRFGNIVRAKALVDTPRGPMRFDLAWGNLNESALDLELSESRFVVIGTEISEKDIEDFLLP